MSNFIEVTLGFNGVLMSIRKDLILGFYQSTRGKNITDSDKVKYMYKDVNCVLDVKSDTIETKKDQTFVVNNHQLYVKESYDEIKALLGEI